MAKGLAKSRATAQRNHPHGNALTSLMLVFPLFLIYQIGILVLPSASNGVDLVTGQLLRLLHGQLGLYVLINAGLGVAFVIAMIVLGRRHEFTPRTFLPTLVESALYAGVMGTLIVLVMQNILHVDPRLATTPPSTVPAGLGTHIVLAFGAGVHEELVFRLIMVGGGVWLLASVLGMRTWIAVVIAFAVSSVLFSAAHVFIGGEPWRTGAFVYRLLCGLIFASLFRWRSFAVAVYTHALYDIFVLVLGKS